MNAKISEMTNKSLSLSFHSSFSKLNKLEKEKFLRSLLPHFSPRAQEMFVCWLSLCSDDEPQLSVWERREPLDLEVRLSHARVGHPTQGSRTHALCHVGYMIPTWYLSVIVIVITIISSSQSVPPVSSLGISQRSSAVKYSSPHQGLFSLGQKRDCVHRQLGFLSKGTVEHIISPVLPV